MSSINNKAASVTSPALRNFFDSIAFRYDFLNTLLSLRLDDYWRRRSRDLLLAPGAARLLDLGTGTGKFLRLFLKDRNWKCLAGLDFSISMLGRARASLPGHVQLLGGDFHSLPFHPFTRLTGQINGSNG